MVRVLESGGEGLEHLFNASVGVGGIFMQSNTQLLSGKTASLGDKVNSLHLIITKLVCICHELSFHLNHLVLKLRVLAVGEERQIRHFL